MEEESKSPADVGSSTLAKLERGLLALAMATAVVLPLNGLPRFDMGQLAVASLVAALAAVLWLFRSMRGAALRGPFGVALLLVLAAGTVAGSAYGQGHGDAYDQAALWCLPLLASLSALSGSGLDASLRRVAFAAVVVTGSAAVLQAFGVTVIPAIPFSTPLEATIRATMDTPDIAFVWFVVAAWYGVSMMQTGSPRLGVATTVIAALGAGLTGQGLPLLLCGAVAAIGAVTLLLRNRGAWKLIAAGIVVAGIGGLAQPNVEITEASRIAARPMVSTMADPMEWPYGDDSARSFFTDTVFAYARAGGLLGHGAAMWPSAQSTVRDADDVFALAHTDGIPIARRAPVPLAELWGDFGPLVPLALLAVLFLAGRWTWKASRFGVAFGLVSFAALTMTSSGVLTAAGMSSLALLLVAAVSVPVQEAPRLTVGPIAVVVVLLMGFVGATQAQALRWGLDTGATMVFMGHSRLDDAQVKSDAAITAQSRYHSALNRSVLQYIRPEGDSATAIAAAQDAVAIRPGSFEARVRVADLYARQTMSEADLVVRLTRLKRMYERLVQLDPNHVETSRHRSSALLAMGQGAAAAETLVETAERPLPTEARATLLVWAGETYEDLEQPEEALVVYERALELVNTAPRRRDISEKIERVHAWAESGVRPQQADGHEGHGH